MPRAAVVNYGVPGYTSFQGRRLLGELLARHRPDFVVLAFGANDLELDVASDAAKAEQHQPAAAPALHRAEPAGDRAAASCRGLSASANGSRSPRAEHPGAARRVPREPARHDSSRAGRRRPRDPARSGPDRPGLPRSHRGDRRAGVMCPGSTRARSCEPASTIFSPAGAIQQERAEIDRFWDQEVEQYRLVYYDESFYRKLARDPIQSGLLRYLMVEPVHREPARQPSDRPGRRRADPRGARPVTRRWLAFGAIVSLAFAVRLAYLLEAQALPLFHATVSDARSYWEWSDRIAAGDWLGDTVFYQAPLYPYFLALVKLARGRGPLSRARDPDRARVARLRGADAGRQAVRLAPGRDRGRRAARALSPRDLPRRADPEGRA